MDHEYDITKKVTSDNGIVFTQLLHGKNTL